MAAFVGDVKLGESRIPRASIPTPTKQPISCFAPKCGFAAPVSLSTRSVAKMMPSPIKQIRLLVALDRSFNSATDVVGASINGLES
jgi:hypothetical protein